MRGLRRGLGGRLRGGGVCWGGGGYVGGGGVGWILDTLRGYVGEREYVGGGGGGKLGREGGWVC